MCIYKGIHMFEKRIVAIHSISDQNLSQNRLIHYIRTMRFLGYKFVSVDTILSDKHNGKLLALTVDDGYKSCIKNLIPVLEKYKIPALMFLPTQLLGLPENHDELLKNECYRNESIMSVEDVNLWVHKGFDIGFHTGKHIDLYYHEDQEIEKDFREGMDIFRKNGWETKYFAYPKGFLPKNRSFFEKLMSKYGIKYAFTICWGGVHADDCYYINRVCLGNHEPFIWSILKTMGFCDYYFLKKRLTIEQRREL